MADPVEFLGTYHAGDTVVVDFPIVDQAGAPFKPTDLFLEHYDEETGTTINGRDGLANIISSYSDAEQKVIFQTLPPDVVLINTKLAPLEEVHRMIFRWTWQGGLKVGSRVFNYILRSRRAAADTQ